MNRVLAFACVLMVACGSRAIARDPSTTERQRPSEATVLDSAPEAEESEGPPDLSFLGGPPSQPPSQPGPVRPIRSDGTCEGIIGLDGQCCSLIRVDGCTPADIEADRARKAEATFAWLATLDSPKQSHGKYPANSRALVRAWFSGTLKDPYSARYGPVSRPRKEHAIDDLDEQKATFGWSVCASVNAKNGFGAYVGSSTFWFLIVNGTIVRSLEIESGDEEIYSGRAVNCTNGS